MSNDMSNPNAISPSRTRSGRLRTIWGVGFAAMLLALAGPASAAYLEVPTSGSDGPVMVDLEGRAVSISVETQTVSARNDEWGINFQISFDVQVVRFVDGPVVLSNMVFGEGMLIGPGGVYSSREAEAGTMVSEIRTMVPRYSSTRSNLAVRFDWADTPTTPIPEPTGALLFGAGLLVAAGVRRRS